MALDAVTEQQSMLRIQEEQMPIITAHILEGRGAAVKTALIRNLTKTVAETLGVPEESVRIILTEMKKDEYGIGGKTARELGR